MADGPLKDALDALDNKITSITGKVESQQQRVRVYKEQLVNKLRQLMEQINKLKTNNNLTSIPQLRQQLEETQKQLIDKTNELETTKTNLAETTQNLQELQINIEGLNKEIQDKTQQIDELERTNGEKDTQITQLQAEKQQLEQQKNEAETNLRNANQQIDTLIQRIGQINANLGNQIELIDRIANELGDLDNDSDEVSIQFIAVSDNIMAIMNIINNPGQEGAEVPTEVPPSGQLFNQDIEQLYKQFMESDQRAKDMLYNDLRGKTEASSISKIQNSISKARNTMDQNDPDVIVIKSELKKLKDAGVRLNFNMPGSYGGKRKYRTMKKRNKKSRKIMKKRQRGGYVYSSSKELDKSSSVISESSGYKTNSNSKTRSKKHTSRRSSRK